MTTKLGIYNDALGLLGERKVASLSEAREPRRVLDDYYDNVIAYCLERGFWNFAMRSVQLDSSASYDPPFGYSYAFEKPTDWVRTFVISANEGFDPPLLSYIDEGGLLYADVDPLFLRYVSNDVAWGLDMSLWTASFSDYVSGRLAVKACKRVTGALPSDELLKNEKLTLATARSRDAMDEPPGFPPTGSWVNSRGGGLSNRSRWNGRSV